MWCNFNIDKQNHELLAAKHTVNRSRNSELLTYYAKESQMCKEKYPRSCDSNTYRYSSLLSILGLAFRQCCNPFIFGIIILLITYGKTEFFGLKQFYTFLSPHSCPLLSHRRSQFIWTISRLEWNRFRPNKHSTSWRILGCEKSAINAHSSSSWWLGHIRLSSVATRSRSRITFGWIHYGRWRF